MIIIENPETREVKTLEKDASGNYPAFCAPWRVKDMTQSILRARSMLFIPNYVQNHIQIQSKLVVYATRMGLPVADFLDAARWLLDYDCSYCQVATEVLRRIDELGDDTAMHFVTRLQQAKASNDTVALNQIRQEISAARIK